VLQEVKEGGIHILVCTVNYVKHDGEKKNFKKFFKFQVTNPISVRTQTHDLQQGIFLSAQVQNVTQSHLFLESVRFEPVPLFVATDLNSVEDLNESKLQNFGDLVYLKSSDIRQYLFKLEAKNPHDQRAKTSTVLGKVDIVWKANLGETGRYQTVPVERKLSTQVDVELTIRNVPAHIILEQPFTVQCELTNRSDKVIVPKLSFLKAQKNSNNNIVVNGLSGQHLGKLPGGSTTTISLNLFPTKPGVQKITSIRIVDEQTDKSYDFHNLIDVFVET